MVRHAFCTCTCIYIYIHITNQSIDRSIDQSTNQSINQSNQINQSINHTIKAINQQIESNQIKRIQIKSNKSTYLYIYLSIHLSITACSVSLSLSLYIYIYIPYLLYVCVQCANIFSPLYICGPIMPNNQICWQRAIPREKESTWDSASIISGTWNDFKHSGHVDTILQPYLQQFPPKKKHEINVPKRWKLYCLVENYGVYYGKH